MTSRSALALSAALLVPCSLLAACGSNVVLPGESGGGSSTSGTGGSTTSTITTGTGVTSTTTTGTTSITTSTTGTGGASSCASISSEVGCLGAFPECVPVYDDACCPSCDPVGGCADCVDIHFHHCAPAADACKKAPCGVTPPWACAGTTANCNINPEGSKTPCHSIPGCTVATCSLNKACDPDTFCVPVTKGSCSTLCDAVPPPCPPDTIAESNGSCYTGLCIPADVCAL